MDTVLDDQTEIIKHLMNIMAEPDTIANEAADDLFDDEYKLALWVKEKDIVRPSGEINLLRTLEPGVYSVDFNRELGPYCQKLSNLSDELFIFSESKTESLLQEIDLFWNKRELYKQNHLIHKRGILLVGFPGTGKTSVITQVANKVVAKGGIVFKVSGFRNLDTYVSFLRTSFRKIQPDTPIITILEDINQYDDVEEQLLEFLDGKTNIDHHLVLATSNNTQEIPETFLRPSRIDLIEEIELPTQVTRREYFQFKGVPEEMLDELVDKTEKCSLSDLKEIYICIFILDYTMEDALDKVITPKEKRNYLHNPRSVNKIGL